MILYYMIGIGGAGYARRELGRSGGVAGGDTNMIQYQI